MNVIKTSKVKCTMKRADNKTCKLFAEDGRMTCKYHTITKEKEEHKEERLCPICLDNVDQNDDAELKCNHAHHIECVKLLRDNVCPVCRAPLISQKLNSNTIEEMEKRKYQDKLERQGFLAPRDIPDDINHPHLPLFFPVDITGRFIENLNTNNHIMMDPFNGIDYLMLTIANRRSRISNQLENRYTELIQELESEPYNCYKDAIEMIIDTFHMLASMTHGSINLYEFLFDRLIDDIPRIYPDIEPSLIYNFINSLLHE